MKCSKVRKEIKAYIDGELRPWTRLLVARHIANCEDCGREMREMTELTNGVRTASAVVAPNGLKGKVLGALTFEPSGRESGKKPFWRSVGGIAAASLGAVLFVIVVLPTLRPASQPLQAKMARSVGVVKDYDLSIQGKLKSNGVASKQVCPPAQPAASRPTLRGAAPRMIVKTADLSVRVPSYSRASDMAISIARSAGGYVSDTSVSSDYGDPTDGCMTLRVPSNAFERTLSRLAKLGTVTSRSISGEDVTSEFIDLDSRMRNLRAEERQYLQIMNRAKRIPDVVTVTNELARVRGEIEEAQGRLKYLKTSSAMSTINLSLREKKRVPPQKSAIEASFGSAVASLTRVANGIASITVWLLVYMPIWALGIVAFLNFRERVHRSATEKQ